MSQNDEFDGYRKWLGITSRSRPPSHYDLLGIKLNEDDHEVILAAAEQRRFYVESKRGIGHDDQVAEILMRIGEAEITLLNNDLRREYDRQLNLFEKRRKSRQVDPNVVRTGYDSKPGRVIGEDNGIVETFAAIVAILCVAFAGMSLFAFKLLPWSRSSSQSEPAPAAAQEPIKNPIVAQVPVPAPIQVAELPVNSPKKRPNLVDVTDDSTRNSTSNSSSVDSTSMDGPTVNPQQSNRTQQKNSADNATSAETTKITFSESDHQIDVLAGDTVITSYHFSEILPRPALHPLQTPSGVVVTRGYPMADGESNDHPNHVGVFVAADGVNDNAFWTTSSRDIHIEHVKITKTEGGFGNGILSTTANWIPNDGKAMLEETRDMQFHVSTDAYAIDFTITLKAAHKKVVFADPKEALFGIRLADWMRVESGQPQTPNGFSGQGTGKYLNSNGAKTEKDVWGRRAKWLRVEATKDGNTVGVAVFDHPQSVNHPTYWHARGYGLLAANPLGQLVFEKTHGSKNAKPLNLTLTPTKSATFRYRVLVYDGSRTKEQLDREFADFTMEHQK